MPRGIFGAIENVEIASNRNEFESGRRSIRLPRDRKHPFEKARGSIREGASGEIRALSRSSLRAR